MEKYKISLVDSGDSAISIRFPQEISEKIHNEVIFYLNTIKRAASEGRISGILDIIPSYAAILIYFDPIITDGEAIKNNIEDLILSQSSKDTTCYTPKTIEIPVKYGDEYGPDFDFVSSHTGLSKEEIIRLHTAPLYPVYMIGFLAGFPYLGGMDNRLSSPRLETPRLSVASGSVGIAGNQTGVYPISSPGGWRIIGRTPLKLYDPFSENPFPVSAGDYIKFVATDEFSESDESTKNHSVNNKTQPINPPSFRILSPGPMTTVQDLGRFGFMDKGLSQSGAMDNLELAKLNTMLGNEINAAGLEATFITPRIEFLEDTYLAVSGIPCPILARKGDVLESLVMNRGIRTYFAFLGGIDIEPTLGSRSTDIKNGIGGIHGRRLEKDDEITLSQTMLSSYDKCISIKEANEWIQENNKPLDNSEVNILYITSGPQYHDIDDDSLKAFLNSEYTVSTASDRMGIRFDGPILTFKEGKDGNIITDGLTPGAIQITPSGNPILMNVDSQTTGGYSKPFWLASVSKQKVAQLRPGDKVKFCLIKTQDALTMWRDLSSSILSK